MSPEIRTTGNPERPIEYILLPGEQEEDIRAKVANHTISARDQIGLAEQSHINAQGQDRYTLAGNYLMLISPNLKEKWAKAIIDAARKNRGGVGVRFRTVYTQRPGGGPREYRDFKFFRR